MSLILQTFVLILATLVANSIQQELKGWPINNRIYVDSGSGLTFVAKDITFSAAGQVIGWKFYSRRSNPLYLQVWRPKSPRSCTLTLIGETRVDVSGTGIKTVNLAENERISVQKGDVIGWKNPKTGVIPFSTNSGAQNLCFKYYLNAEVGTEYDVTQRITWRPNRSYSVAAIFSDQPREYEIGFPIINRSYRDSGSVMTFVDKRTTIPADGRLTGWEFYAKATGRINLQVWRPEKSGQCNNMLLVAEIRLQVSSAGVATLPLSDPIQVKAGDLIGWSNPGKGVIAFGANFSSRTQNQCFGFMSNSNVGQRYNPTGRITWATDRTYSIKAHLSEP